MHDSEHPMVLPEELPRRAIKHSPIGDVVLDPLSTGAGTTTFAAASPGFTGIDISAEYCSRTVMARAASGNRDRRPLHHQGESGGGHSPRCARAWRYEPGRSWA
ncbi:MAG: site-specific DNA-methyltransferase [Candidatus Methanoculleus thermohydrogenotrophicum]|nr:site-specific DNA-methyltransferase [Candidatus Methanoculleus thermohydrogenotrophicum]